MENERGRRVDDADLVRASPIRVKGFGMQRLFAAVAQQQVENAAVPEIVGRRRNAKAVVKPAVEMERRDDPCVGRGVDQKRSHARQVAHVGAHEDDHGRGDTAGPNHFGDALFRVHGQQKMVDGLVARAPRVRVRAIRLERDLGFHFV